MTGVVLNILLILLLVLIGAIFVAAEIALVSFATARSVSSPIEASAASWSRS